MGAKQRKALAEQIKSIRGSEERVLLATAALLAKALMTLGLILVPGDADFMARDPPAICGPPAPTL